MIKYYTKEKAKDTYEDIMRELKEKNYSDVGYAYAFGRLQVVVETMIDEMNEDTLDK